MRRHVRRLNVTTTEMSCGYQMARVRLEEKPKLELAPYDFQSVSRLSRVRPQVIFIDYIDLVHAEPRRNSSQVRFIGGPNGKSST